MGVVRYQGSAGQAIGVMNIFRARGKQSFRFQEPCGSSDGIKTDAMPNPPCL